MADALGVLEKIVKTGLTIKKAVETFRQNKEECRDIQRCVAIVTILMSSLKQSTMGEVMSQYIMAAALDDLAEGMEKALRLITECQQKNALLHLFGARDMARKLSKVQEEIMNKVHVANLATNTLQIHFSISVKRTLEYIGPHPAAHLQSQVAGEVNSYDNNLSANEMRSGVNCNTTMEATGNAVPYASSSRLAEFNWSEQESTLQLSSEEQISKGGHHYVLKQRIVIKVPMESDKSRSKAMQLVAAAGGVHSVAITGDGKDQVEVVGDGVDTVMVISALRRKLGYAHLLMVDELRRGNIVSATRPRGPGSGSPLSDSDDESPLLLSSQAPRLASLEGSKEAKQTTLKLEAQPHQQEEVLPHVVAAAAPARPDDGAGPSPSPSPGGIMAHLRAAAVGLKASGHQLHESLVPAYGIIFVFAFLLYLKIVASGHV